MRTLFYRDKECKEWHVAGFFLKFMKASQDCESVSNVGRESCILGSEYTSPNSH